MYCSGSRPVADDQEALGRGDVHVGRTGQVRVRWAVLLLPTAGAGAGVTEAAPASRSLSVGYTLAGQLPKLDVASSNLVTRSIDPAGPPQSIDR